MNNFFFSFSFYFALSFFVSLLSRNGQKDDRRAKRHDWIGQFGQFVPVISVLCYPCIHVSLYEEVASSLCRLLLQPRAVYLVGE